MFVVGITGGIGAGKSAVADLLAERGAVVLDADRISREVVEPGTDGLREIVEAFGEDVLGPDGSLDRKAVADVVFTDDEKRKTLESIIHPRVGLRISERLGELAQTDEVVVLDIPLLAETARRGGSASYADMIVVVEAPEEDQLRRLEAKGIGREDARARMAAQATAEERRAIANHVIENSGSLDDLRAAVDELWAQIEERAGRARG